ncbi:S8 family peptidase [Blastococcus sp. PRF04-17]|uniref:S8 family peptidase n=1 Tax=Blastococcus sp. PRF04-17 TaxID=2933797 RepID=UPI001FF4AB94|nr:S8 family peptidase [Blastococcus sp. PRF04-17]UOY02960.1 S8 family peptidase [Blastococcus sp. PRF04-17]
MPIRRNLGAAAVVALTATGLGATVGDAAAAPPAQSAVETYIVTLDGGSVPAQVAARAERRFGGRTEHVYTATLNGFAIQLPVAAADRLHALDGVVAVEADQPITVAESAASWGLDRIDQRTLPLSGTYTAASTGAGVTAYIIDTGIQFSNVDFGGRAVSGYDAVDGGSADDCNGHGTHVAGTVGGTKHGVAKDVRLVAVRVLDCRGSGTTAGVIAGVEWVTKHRTSPAVANMSLGGGVSTALDNAVSASIASGVTYAVAAGNGNSRGVPQDACTVSPARVGSALTVGATDKTDAAASFSNYGACVDLFAPGVGITSAWYARKSTTATKTISGTSMASPHVAGVAALFLQNAPDASPASVATAITDLTTKDAVPTSATANNDLLFTSY